MLSPRSSLPPPPAQVARVMLDTLAEHRLSTGQPLRCRIGIAVGAVICGVLGRLQPRFHVLGSGIRAAEKLEQTGRPDCVHARCGAMGSVGSIVCVRARACARARACVRARACARASAAPCDRLDLLCVRVPARWRGAAPCERKRSTVIMVGGGNIDESAGMIPRSDAYALGLTLMS